MKRTTPHCACHNTSKYSDGNFDQNSKVYSFLPNYYAKLTDNSVSPEALQKIYQYQNDFKRQNRHRTNNVEENCSISNSLRPQSCPANRNEEYTENIVQRISQLNSPQNDVISKKNRNHSLKNPKLYKQNVDKLYQVPTRKSDNLTSEQIIDCQYQDFDCHFNSYSFANSKPIFTNTDEPLLKEIPKKSCGLKYILLQKISLMSGLFMKPKKSKFHSSNSQLSDENLFQQASSKTKRSKSFQMFDRNLTRQHLHNVDSKCEFHKMLKKTNGAKSKISDASNSSSGSIDAHAGSPITIMATVCNNIFPNISNSVPSNALFNSTKFAKGENRGAECHSIKTKKEDNILLNSPPNPKRCNVLNSNCQACYKCYHSSQSPCMQLSQGHRCNLCYIPQVPHCSTCHCCCFNYCHFLICSPHPDHSCMCYRGQNSHCHCGCQNGMVMHNYYQFPPLDNSHQTVLCSRCQTKNINKCCKNSLSHTKRDCLLQHQSSKSHIHLINSNNAASVPQKRKSKSENKNRYKHSPLSLSKSTSIPPPPPPPPSSLYSGNEPLAYRRKQKKSSCSHLTNKKCGSCPLETTHELHSTTDNAQNIIYSHLNKTVNCLSQNVELSDEFQNYPLCSLTIPESEAKDNKSSLLDECTDNTIIQELKKFSVPSEKTERNVKDFHRQYISKTPDNYKSKTHRKQRKLLNESSRTKKLKSSSVCREYNINDNDLIYRNDSLESAEAGSFICSSVSPLIKNINQSSFTIRQHIDFSNIRNCRTESARKAFQENMLSLKEVGWYWGPLSFTEAERLMKNRANGTFIIRDSGHDTYFLSLTFRVRETTYHTRIEYSQGTFSFWSQPESHSATTIVEFIDKAVAHSQSGKFHYFLLTEIPGQPPMEVSLLYPLSRFQIVHSLKHLSRFVILGNIRRDHIWDLSIPLSLKSYLMEKQYYIGNLDQFIELTQDAYPLSYKPSTSN